MFKYIKKYKNKKEKHWIKTEEKQFVVRVRKQLYLFKLLYFMHVVLQCESNLLLKNI